MEIYVNKNELALKKDIINPNLIDGSATAENFISAFKDRVVLSDSTYQGLAIIDNKQRVWGGYGPYVQLEKDKIYTFSFYAKTLGPDIKTTYLTLNPGLDDNKGAASLSGTVSFDLPKEKDWQRYSLTFTALNTGFVHPRIEMNGENSEILSAGYKLEEGATATPWCPSINDLATGLMDIQALKSKMGGYQSLKPLVSMLYTISESEVAA